MGDFGTGEADQRSVAAAIRREHDAASIDALITTGDNIYPDARPEFFEDAWHEPYGWTVQQRVRVLAALGNHDVETDPGPVMDLLGMPSRWYATRVGLLEIVVLDSTRIDSARQQAFLERALASPPRRPARYRVVVLHHPPFSCSKHKNDEAVLDAWQPVFLDGHVDLVLSGHDHVYERFEPLEGVTYVVTGGGGYELHDMGACPDGNPALAADAEKHHYLRIEATEGALRVQAISPDDVLLDVVRLE